MPESTLNSNKLPENIAKQKVKLLCLFLDEDVVDDVRRLRASVNFSIEDIISESLQPLLKSLLPVTSLMKQGNFTPEAMLEPMKTLNLTMLKAEAEMSKYEKILKKSKGKRSIAR